MEPENTSNSEVPSLPANPETIEPAPAAEIHTDTSGNVNVPADQWTAMMARLQRLEDEDAFRAKTEDKNRANQIDALRRSGKLLKSVKVRTLQGKFVRMWKKLLIDEVYKDEDGKLKEKQSVGLYLMEEAGQDDTYVEMPLRQWAVVAEYVPCEVVRESKEENGDLYLTVRTKEGQEFQINVIYVN